MKEELNCSKQISILFSLFQSMNINLYGFQTIDSLISILFSLFQSGDGGVVFAGCLMISILFSLFQSTLSFTWPMPFCSYFHTIQSISKPVFIISILFSRVLFPYYLVYFKAEKNDKDIYNYKTNFHTIQSISKRIVQERYRGQRKNISILFSLFQSKSTPEKDPAVSVFPYYLVYFKASIALLRSS